MCFSEERASKGCVERLGDAHPLLGRMSLPVYRAGTVKVAALRRQYPPEEIIPALFGVQGAVDLVTIDSRCSSWRPHEDRSCPRPAEDATPGSEAADATAVTRPYFSVYLPQLCIEGSAQSRGQCRYLFLPRG